MSQDSEVICYPRVMAVGVLMRYVLYFTITESLILLMLDLLSINCAVKYLTR